jgi:CubicO group peptidase (beta-lactamase class C family)
VNIAPSWIDLRRSRSGRQHACRVAGLAGWVALAGVSAATAGSTIEQRIQRGLLPPVLVKGDSTQLTALSTRMEALHVPGVSMAVIHAGRLEWARGFGVMQMGGRPVTAATLFQAASISKVVSTLAVMELAQGRKLDLDTDVNQYLETWKLPTSELTRQAKVTLRGLLTHSAGITVHGFAGYEAGAPLPNLVQILNGEPPANNPPIRVDATPGMAWRYSGGGFLIAQQVLTGILGKIGALAIGRIRACHADARL